MATSKKDVTTVVTKLPSFRGFEGIERVQKQMSVSPPVPIPKDGLLSAIFAPDPETGMPRSDLHIQLSGSLDPNVQEYIRRTFQRPLPSSDVGHENPDVVLDSARNYNERIDDYVLRLKNMVENPV